MADLETRVLLDGPAFAVVQIVNFSGSSETANLKVDVSTLSDVAPGVPCAEVAIREIKGATIGLSVVARWDSSTDQGAFVVPPSHTIDVCYDVPLVNPKATGWTGDLMITTIGGVASSTAYDLQLTLEKRGL